MHEVPGQRFAPEGLGLAAARVGDGVAGRPVEVRAVALGQLRVPCLLVGPVDGVFFSEIDSRFGSDRSNRC